MSISIIIPVYNEEESISQTLDLLFHRQSSKQLVKEVIVVDGGSQDHTTKKVLGFKKVILLHSQKGRPHQMNFGAQHATGEVLYFLHADSYPPQDYDLHIMKAIQKNSKAGCFKMRFDHNHPWMRFISWLTKFNSRACRGGDQSLFVCKTLFNKVGGYDENFMIFEDHELIAHLYKQSQFTVIQQTLVSSARRFRDKGILRLQLLFWAIYFKKWLGASPKELYDFYQKYIN